MPLSAPPLRSRSPRTTWRTAHRAAARRAVHAARAPFAVPGVFGAPRTDTSLEEHASPRQERAMRSFWWDGVFSSLSEIAVINYLGIYAVAFGASNVQIALLASLTSLAAAAAFMPGARLADATGKRKAIVLFSSGGVARVSLLGLAAIPFFFQGGTAVWCVIALASARSLFANFGIPAWTSLTADIVPIGVRGRFLASRNIGMGLACLPAAPLAGFIIGRFAGFGGWEIVWLASFAFGAASTWFYSRIAEPAHPPTTATSTGSVSILGDLLNDRGLVLVLLNAAVWNLSLQAAGPFFNVYLVRNLEASAMWVGILTGIPLLFGLAGAAYFGRAMDRAGTKRVLMITGLLIPALPLAWVFVTSVWQITFINAAGGALWAGHTLALVNLTMVMAPRAKRARYAAAVQTVSFGAQFAGPLLGAWLISLLGFKLLFAVSAAGRLAATGLLAAAPVREHAD